MERISLAVLAHVDAGKTTMSEALLYKCGTIRTLGRVDHKDAFLDTDYLERQRGITIFSKQAMFSTQRLGVTLLDTPGHVDFSSEMERVLSVLDYALLIVSGPDGIQAHTQTLWSLLRKYKIPTFIFVNKMDQLEGDAEAKERLLVELRKHFSASICDFSNFDILNNASPLYEELASSDEKYLEQYLETGKLSISDISELIYRRKVFPCYFGSALKSIGVDELISGLNSFAKEPKVLKEFGAKVFKITRDNLGNRLSWIKLTGGNLKVRQMIGEEKITQIRIYNGEKYSQPEEVVSPCICALTGLNQTYAGEGLGFESNASAPILEPVLSYNIQVLNQDKDIRECFSKLLILSEEDPMLRIVWNSTLRTIEAQFMGKVQVEVLKQIIKDRFDLDVEIGTGKILYKETIASPVLGKGHFEPLRHYAEVHLLMEPLPSGSGIVFDTQLSIDVLDLNWQRLILTNLAEKTHIGVLTGSPITDMKISLVAGRDHLKHTEGGDFRQAVYRAVRQGLMKAENILLEPYFDFVLDLPSEYVGRAIADIKAMSSDFSGPFDFDGQMEIKGRGPVSELGDYGSVLASYTKGKGRISCNFAGYYPCHNTEKIVEEIAYDANRDIENTADSVFCSHGAGVVVRWDAAEKLMHLETSIETKFKEDTQESEIKFSSAKSTRNLDLDEKELEEIMNREFGPIKRPKYTAVNYDYNKDKKSVKIKKEYFLVDGYNLIFANKELKDLAATSFAIARAKLEDILSNFAAFTETEMVLVFDGYRVKDNKGTKGEYKGIKVAYTKEGESADAYIQNIVHEIGKNYSVKVVSSDAMIQLVALQLGCIRVSSPEFWDSIYAATKDIDRILASQEKFENKIENYI